MIRQRKSPRRAVAAIELALVTAGILIPLMFGVWEIGRMIQVKQVLANSAREGARLAAQGFTLDSTGATRKIYATKGTEGSPAAPRLNVHEATVAYLRSMGFTKLNTTNVTTSFEFTENGYVNNSKPTHPYLGDKGQAFKVTVTIPWAQVRWINSGVINPTSLTVTVQWEMLRDDEFTVKQDLPNGYSPDTN